MKENLKKVLSPIQFAVTQLDATEPPFDNEFWNHFEEGIYVDIVSGEPLFCSHDKFDSHCGWPSFSKALNELIEVADHKIGYKRIEVRSIEADSHLGHVFDDGPGPTGFRYCINSAALRFISKDDLDKEGYAEFKKLFT